MADQRFSQPHHCIPQWLASVLLNSSLRPAMAREPQSVGGPSWATTALLRLSHVLEHTSASKNDVPAKCFRLQAIRCILHAHRDYARHTRTFRSDILHQHVLQLDSSLCSEPDASFMFGTNCPSLDDRPGATTLYACHTLVFCDASSFSLSPSCCARPTCTSCHHSIHAAGMPGSASHSAAVVENHAVTCNEAHH